MLFLLVMQVLNALIRKAEQCHLLQDLAIRSIPHRASLYAMDFILFLYPRARTCRFYAISSLSLSIHLVLVATSVNVSWLQYGVTWKMFKWQEGSFRHR
jgi:hypothetical protein